MRIGIDARHLTYRYPSGVGYYTIELIRHLAALLPEEDHLVLLVSGGSDVQKYFPHFDDPKIEIASIRMPNRLLYAHLLRPFGPTLESFLPHPPDLWLFPNLNIVRTNLPYLLTVHDVSFKWFPQFFTAKDRLWNKLTRFNQRLHEASGLLAVSEATKHDLVSRLHIDEARIRVTLPGVRSIFSPKAEPSDDQFVRRYGVRAPYILSLCTQEPRKNIPSIIEGYGLFRDDFTGGAPHLVIAGGRGWKMRSIEQALGASSYASNIHTIGYVEDMHKPALYRGASCFVFPSYYEGFGLPILEAMASGTQVITSFTSSLPEVAGDAAIYVDPFNVQDIADALALHHDVAQCPATLDVGLSRSASFSWNKTAQKTYEELCRISSVSDA
jgi:glycosyltransferase involved in cell wall biosynthesis